MSDTPDKKLDLPSVTIENEMKNSYLDYAMSVIVGRALPDVRDGLKPVHRRILYLMQDEGYDYNKPFKKSGYIVGGVMGKYHPHGDDPIYQSMVRMAQDFSLRVPLIHGQGNFGSMDGDPPAAFRYTEARLAKAAHSMVADIDKDTVDFQQNYDGSLNEPRVLPARFPNLLVNGAEGIAVGMATSIPTHNLGEIIDACCAQIDNPDITAEELFQIVPGPDFPTGGIILGRSNILKAYQTGRGSILVRSKTHIEGGEKTKQAIVVTEIPYQVNKARMVERIAYAVKEKIVEGISDIRDESSREGVRVVIELKRDASPDVVLNQLYKHSPLQTFVSFNMLAIHKGRPEQLSLKNIIAAFLAFREDVIIRRSKFELKKARDKAHLLLGMAVAVANIDEVIALIKAAPDPQTAREQLMERNWLLHDVGPLVKLVDPHADISGGTYNLTELQAKAILEMRLHRLTNMERNKISDDLEVIIKQIEELLHILSSRPRLLEILREELVEVKTNFSTPRRTEIQDGDFDQSIEDLIEREDMAVSLSMSGYIKRVPLDAYKSQRRGGKGRSGMSTREEDAVKDIFVANTHAPVLFFTTHGRVFQKKVFMLPESSLTGRGKPLVNLIPLEKEERIATIMPMPEDKELWSSMYMLFATSKGSIRKSNMSDYARVFSSGKRAIQLADDEELVAVVPTTDEHDVFIASNNSKAIRFPVDSLRVIQSRSSTGVRGMNIEPKDTVMSISTLHAAKFDAETREQYLRYASAKRRDEPASHDLDDETFAELERTEQFILTVTDKGYAKRTSSHEYRTTARGGKGITNIDSTDKNGRVVASFPVDDTDDIVLMTNAGTILRCPVGDIRICGRSSQGVIVFRVSEGERIVSAAHLPGSDEEDESEETSGEL